MIVTHNMQQAARASDITAFFNLEETGRPGRLVEVGATETIFTSPDRAGDRGLREREVRMMSPSGVRVEYQEELEQLEASALGGLDLVIAALERTLEAVEHQDVELAGLVIADDDRIDGRYLEVHQALITLLATQSPVATDLRLISALLHVLKNVERMGDQCVNICKMIPLSGNEPPADEEMVRLILTMGRQTKTADRPGEALLRRARRRPWRRTWSARTTSSTTSTATASGWRSRSATTPTSASGR